MPINKPTKVISIEGGGGGGSTYYNGKEKDVTSTPTPTNDDIIAGTGLFPGMVPGLSILSHDGRSISVGSTGGKPGFSSITHDGISTDVGSTGEAGGSEAGGSEEVPAINAALGTPDFTWEQDAANRAGTQLSKDVETTRKEFLESKRQLDQAAQQGQDQYSMSKYSQNQSIEKAGWAGGYVLDAQRQTEYLKQSIKAQMYGQMELQAMGYDSQLAAARLAYDLGKQDLARQYYQDAVANQVQKAQLTGVWVSPEVNDMLTQSQAATAILAKKEGLSDEEKLLDKEYQQARHLKDQVVNWFAETGLSEAGVDTLAKMTFDLDVQAFNESKIQAALESMEPGQYVVKNADGSYKMNDATGRPEVIDLNVASPEEQWDFFNTDYGHIALRNQVNNLASQTMQNFINNTPGLEDMSNSQFQTAFDKYLESGTNDLVKDYVNQFGSNDIMQRLINTHPEVFVNGEYSYSFKSGDDTYTYKFNKTTSTGGTTGGTSTTPATVDVLENYTNTDDLLDTLTNPQLEGGVNEVVDLIINTDFGSMGTSDWNNFWDDFFITGFYVNAFGSGKNAKRTAAEINSILEQIDTAIGPDNMALMIDKNIQWNKLTDREKALLSSTERESYERNEEFITHYITMKEVLKEAEMNDSNIFSGSWQYTADVWKRNAQKWKEADNLAEGVNAFFDSGVAVGSTVVDSIVSVVRGIFHDWWK